jgi:hypothetical protein
LRIAPEKFLLKAIVHIGTAKAGSSAIQYFIAKNRGRLKQAGYYVPVYRPNRQYGFQAYAITSIQNMGKRRLENQLGIHSQADLEVFQAEFKQKAQNDLAEASAGNSHMLLSAEGFASRSLDEIERLRDLLAPSCSEFVIVVYLRRQDLRRASGFRLGIKNSGGTGDEVFYNEFNEKYDYHAICDRWAQIFGESHIRPRIFPDSALKFYNLIDDFAQLSGIADTSVFDELERPGRRNQAWDWRAVEFNRLINNHLPAFEDGKVPPERKRLEGVLKTCFPECEQRMPARADAIRFYEMYHDSNERLRARWFPHQSSLFNEDFSRYPEQADLRKLSVTDAVYIASRILQAG